MAHLRGKRLALLHDARDRTTDYRGSREFSERARRAGADAQLLTMPRGRHTMLRGMVSGTGPPPASPAPCSPVLVRALFLVLFLALALALAPVPTPVPTAAPTAAPDPRGRPAGPRHRPVITAGVRTVRAVCWEPMSGRWS
ncbi:hypothetical protein [Streptomyces sp. NPDC057579]|uniref:hypothetical protein n=1 Tax=Streptomyces sp. NPDC057579 TaxID=3346172 RepID=UPI00369BF8BC